METVNGEDYVFSASVSLLTRNIKITSDPSQSENVLGGRVFVSVSVKAEGENAGDVNTGTDIGLYTCKEVPLK